MSRAFGWLSDIVRALAPSAVLLVGLSASASAGSSTTSLSSSRPATALGESVGLTARVRTDGAFAAGAVTFKAGTKVLGEVQLSADRVQFSTQIDLGDNTSCVIATDGSTQCWGSAVDGRLGNDETTGNFGTPQAVATTTIPAGGGIFRAISVGGEHACAIGTTGLFACWGSNSFGQLGNGGAINPSQVPFYIDALKDEVAGVSAGALHTCIVTTDGAAKCWGFNLSGQLGNDDPNLATQSSPVDVTGLSSGVAAVAAGNLHSCALMTSGEVKCWGRNNNGQLGTGSLSPSQSASPVAVTGLSGSAIAISTQGDHTCVVITGGTVQCWGLGTDGQLGNSADNTSASPVTTSGITDAVAIAVGDHHSCALRSGGAISCWGRNSSGQGGNSGTAASNTPVAVTGLTNAVALAAGASHTCAILATGLTACWGESDNGRLGNNQSSDALEPASVPGTSTLPFSTATFRTNELVAGSYNLTADYGGDTSTDPSVSSAISHTVNRAPATATMALSVTAARFGDSVRLTATVLPTTTGLPTGSVTFRDNGVALGSATLQPAAAMPVKLGGGDFFSCALTSAGAVNCWGSNLSGQLGIGSLGAGSLTPVAATVLTSGIVSIATGGAHGCALTAAGVVKCWGRNDAGQVRPDITSDEEPTPAEVPGLGSGVKAIAAGGGHTCAITSAGGVKCWGDNSRGQLGDGTTNQPGAPVDVQGLASGVVGITAGGRHTCALTSAGAVKCWGINVSGQLGDGTTADSAEPVATSGLGSGVTAIAIGNSFTCARTLAGAAMCWGANNTGQLGTGDKLDQTTPVSPSGLESGVTAIDGGFNNLCALMATGAVKCLGTNASGQLGNNPTTLPESLSAVTVIGLESGVTAMTVGANHACAVTAAGAVRCWGTNPNGQLGDGTTTSSDKPLHVAGLAAVAGMPATASLTLSTLTGGNHAITAAYAGGANHLAANSASSAIAISRIAPGSVTLSSSDSLVAIGTAVTLTARVASPKATPTGTVTFKRGSTILGSARLVSGVASLKVASLPLGSHTLVAAYGGNTNFNSRTSAGLAQKVVRIATRTSAKARPVVVGAGDPARVTIKVLAGGSSRPTGRVDIMEGSVKRGSGRLSRGKVTVTLRGLGVGRNRLIAIYRGSARHAASRSASFVVKVRKAPTRTLLTASLADAPVGTPVTLTATIAGADGASGKVDFLAGARKLGTARISGGTARFEARFDKAATHQLRAVYAGNDRLSPSTSPAISLKVAEPRAPSTTTLVVTSEGGEGSDMLVAVTAVDAAPTGEVSVMAGSRVLATARLKPAHVIGLGLAGAHGCVVWSDGAASCWAGASPARSPALPDTKAGFTAAASLGQQDCLLAADGVVHCRTLPPNGRSAATWAEETTFGTGIRQIASDGSAICVTASPASPGAGIACFTAAEAGNWTALPGLEAARIARRLDRQMRLSEVSDGNTTCRIRPLSALACFTGDAARRPLPAPTPGHRASATIEGLEPTIAVIKSRYPGSKTVEPSTSAPIAATLR